MNFWTFACRNLIRRPLRTSLAFGGLAISVASVVALHGFGTGYQASLRTALDRTGLQLMLVPLGCPYEAAARILDGSAPESTLPESAVTAARQDPAVAIAVPFLLHAVPRLQEGRTELWTGLDTNALALKPWWKAQRGSAWFGSDSNSVILGSNVAEVELRQPGDAFHSPEAGVTLRVAGILARSGTADDNAMFLPLATAQRMFGLEGRITAIGMRLHDPEQLSQATRRLQAIPGAQVVTATEMMGALLNLLGTVRTLLVAIAVIAAVTAGLGVFNTTLANILERSGELALLRALGASRVQVAGLLALETATLALAASTTGALIAGLGAGPLETLLRHFVPMTPSGTLVGVSVPLGLRCIVTSTALALIAIVYPVVVALRLQPAAAAKAT